jgi:hypothetical protein
MYKVGHEWLSQYELFCKLSLLFSSTISNPRILLNDVVWLSEVVIIHSESECSDICYCQSVILYGSVHRIQYI